MCSLRSLPSPGACLSQRQVGLTHCCPIDLRTSAVEMWVNDEHPGLGETYQVGIVAFVDSGGVTFLKKVFFLAHSRKIPETVRNVLKVVGMGIFFVLTYLTIGQLTTKEFEHVLSLFIPAWLSARSAEVFKVATIWAMKMQYGGGKGSLGLL
mmetsp:Transcript_29160/g.78245  ORF Transcript_29160/g.78245 Transcript_29160/m.78245 type:complete len:152 (-) Transcript_29160:91-546(-)